MAASVRWRLSVMMFLQFAIWGAWAPVLGPHLTNLKFSGEQTGFIFGLLPLASIFAPMIFGQIADRYLPTQWILGVLHLLGGVFLWRLASVTEYQPFMLNMLLFSICYAPTLVLTNSLAFANIGNAEKEFGSIRVLGTIGWIAAGLTLGVLMHRIPGATFAEALRLGAYCSIALGLFSFALPHTPPKKEGTNPWAFLEAFSLLKDRNFLIFILISFVVATELQFYYIPTGDFLQYLGVKGDNVSTVMTLGQIAEIFVMALMLPAVLPRVGLRKALVLGIIAWPIRYAIFALGATVGASMQWLVIASLTLHGFCYVFFFTVGYIYVDQVAPPHIRASAQSLIGIVTNGIGLYVGSFLTGKVLDHYKVNGVENWQGVFLIPCVLTVLCALVFPFLFRDRRAGTPNETLPEAVTVG